MLIGSVTLAWVPSFGIILGSRIPVGVSVMVKRALVWFLLEKFILISLVQYFAGLKNK